jgi:hypothetical protein
MHDHYTRLRKSCGVMEPNVKAGFEMRSYVTSPAQHIEMDSCGCVDFSGGVGVRSLSPEPGSQLTRGFVLTVVRVPSECF